MVRPCSGVRAPTGEIHYINSRTRDNVLDNPIEPRYRKLVELIKDARRAKTPVDEVTLMELMDPIERAADVKEMVRRPHSSRGTWSCDNIQWCGGVVFGQPTIFSGVMFSQLTTLDVPDQVEALGHTSIFGVGPYSRAEYMGIDVEKEMHLVWVAKLAVIESLPEGWEESQAADGRVLYVNQAEGSSRQGGY